MLDFRFHVSRKYTGRHGRILIWDSLVPLDVWYTAFADGLVDKMLSFSPKTNLEAVGKYTHACTLTQFVRFLWFINFSLAPQGARRFIFVCLFTSCVTFTVTALCLFTDTVWWFYGVGHSLFTHWLCVDLVVLGGLSMVMGYICLLCL